MMKHVLFNNFISKKLRLIFGVLFLFVIGACTPVDETPQTISISSISPTSGDIGGGYTVTIRGSNFTYIESVDFGGVACTDISTTKDTLACTVPSTITAGSVAVTVTGRANRSASTTFTYTLSAPTVTSFSPDSGTVDGGTSVFISGTGFASTTTATIGGIPCLFVNVLNSTMLECISPVLVAGSYPVVVTNANGLSATAATTYAYNETPTLTSLTPIVGSTAGGTTITLTGTDFLSGARVYIGSTSCGSVNVVSSTTITCVTASTTTTGLQNVRVTNDDNQSAVLNNAFTYYGVPTISTISPTAGAIGGGSTITVTGTNFTSATTMEVGGVACATLTYVSATSMTCVTPNQVAGAYAVTAYNPGTATATYNSFTYQDGPDITAVTPNAGPLAGSTALVITGTNFRTGATVLVGTASCAVTSLTATQIDCTTSANVAGTYAVTVTNTDTQTDSELAAFTYQPAPTVTSVSPAYGAVGGLTNVVVNGSGFSGVTAVTIGGNTCNITAQTATTVDCTTTAGTAGPAGVTVVNGDGQITTLAAAYTYLNPPTYSSVSPNAGTLSGGTTITITGNSFFTNPIVYIDGVVCNSINLVDATTITCQTPPGAAGAVDVVIENADGQTVTGVGAYTYQAAPTVASISPSNGPATGTTNVTITGTGFVTGAAVDIGGVACTSVTISVPDTEITCTAQPSATTGLVAVTVTNADGQAGTMGGLFTYDPAPTVTSVTPDVGPSTGPTAITISGTDFDAAATVAIDGVACANVVVTPPNTITCDTANVVAGEFDVVVTNPDSQTGTLTNGFVVLDPPTVTSVSPDAGALAGGTTITITGTNFVNDSVVTVDGVACTTQTVVSATSITCVTPGPNAGAVAVVVTNPDAATDSGTFTYQAAPTVTSVTANNGPYTGGTTVVIAGTGFVTGATVDFGTNACTSVTVDNANQITCDTPAGTAGAVAVTVTNADGQSGSAAGAFTYNPAPTITSLSPSIGPVGGGQTLTVNGTGFDTTLAQVDIGGAACAVTARTSTSITCTTGVGTAGLQTVTVDNQDGLTGTYNSYRYLNPPTLTSISPIGGSPNGGTTVTITGADFLSGAQVTFNGSLCGSINVVNSTTITCVTPSGVAGAATVVVSNVDTQSDTDATLFSYNDAPVISAVSPAYGTLGGGGTVTITGTGFVNHVTLLTATFGSNTVSCTWNSSVSMTCPVPASLLTGAVNLTVTNPDGQSHTITNGFTYLQLLSVTSISPSTSPAAGGGTATISGSDFYTGATVTIGGVACTSPTVVNSSTITCTIPAGAIGPAVDVVVTNPDNQTDTIVGGFTYQGAPTVTTLSTQTGVVSGGTNLTINGTNFATGATVSIGGANCASVVVVSSVQITCVTAANSAGTYTVRVTNADGQYNTSSGQNFTYRALPVAANISPSSGPVTGTGTLTVNGSGFVAGDVVQIGSSTCATVSLTATQITCTIPAQAAGSYNVSVTTPDNSVSTLTNAYAYRDLATVTSVSPNSGTLAGNTLITITGTNFLPGSTVNIDGTTCTSVSVVSSTSITCRTGAKVAGTYDVNVVGPNMPAATLAAAYTHVATPILGFHTGTISPNPPNPDNWGSTSTNVTHTFTLRNTGEAATSAISVSIIGSDPGAWIIGTNNCTTLAASASCTVQVTYLGSFNASGTYSATLQATATSGGTVTNSLQGSTP